MDAEGEQGDDPFDHPALFYRDPQEYLAGSVPFIREGLAAGEPVAASVPKPNLRLLREALGDDADSVRLLDMTEVGRNPGRILADVLHAMADPHPDRHVRIIGEPIWPTRTQLEYPACLQHEALINESFPGRQLSGWKLDLLVTGYLSAVACELRGSGLIETGLQLGPADRVGQLSGRLSVNEVRATFARSAVCMP